MLIILSLLSNSCCYCCGITVVISIIISGTRGPRPIRVSRVRTVESPAGRAVGEPAVGFSK